MLQKTCVFLLLAAAFLQCVVGQDFCYRANITNGQSTNGNVSTRANVVETAVQDMLNELGNDTSTGFATNARNQTLEAVESAGSISVYRVLICLTNSSLNEAQFTQVLADFNFTTQIDSNDVMARDYDECGGNYNTSCHQFADCNNKNGSFECVCQDEYHDRRMNNITGQMCELPTNFTCSSNAVDVTAINPYFENLGINYTTLRLGSCSGNLVGDEILFSGECGAVVEENDTHVFYKWNLTNVNESASVTIGNYVTIPITCTFVSSSNISINVSADRRDIVFGDDLNNVPGEAYEFTADAFLNRAASQRLTGAINTNTKIYFRLGTSNSLPSNTRIQCDEFSTSAADGSSLSIQLMTKGCPARRTPSNGRILDTLDVVSNGQSGNSVVGVNSHFFGTTTITTAKFGLTVCAERQSNNGTCAITCTNRKKRGIVTFRMKRETVGSGEVQFAFERSPGDGCTRDCNEGGICVYDALRNQECVCADGFVRQEDGTCRDENRIDTNEDRTTEENTIMIVLLSVIAALVVIALGITLVFVLKRRRRQGKAYDLTYDNTYAIDQKMQ